MSDDHIENARGHAAESHGLQSREALQIEIWHNILWSRYKAEVFSAMWSSADKRIFALNFIQVAESDAHRTSLSGVDLSRHQYPFELLFTGLFRDIGLLQRLRTTWSRALSSTADLTILSGYERPECWLQLFILLLRGRKAALFLDSTINDRAQRFLTGVLKRVFFKGLVGIFGYGIRSKEYATHYGMSADRVFIPCLTAALPDGYRPELALLKRNHANIQVDSPRFVYVGRLSGEKGLDVLIEAFALVRAQLKNATLTIVGDGDRRDALLGAVSALEMNDAVAFTGSMTGEALYEEFSRATALVLPSLSEPWGLVVNEAFAYGCPAIVSDRCGCVPELLSEGKTGFVHQAGNARDLADKMLLAPAAFGNVDTTAMDCLGRVERYTPARAARTILDGCQRILIDNADPGFVSTV